MSAKLFKSICNVLPQDLVAVECKNKIYLTLSISSLYLLIFLNNIDLFYHTMVFFFNIEVCHEWWGQHAASITIYKNKVERIVFFVNGQQQILILDAVQEIMEYYLIFN